MKKYFSTLLVSLLILTGLAVPGRAQNQPLPPLDPELQKFLNVPVWYLNYHIELTANGSGGNDMGSWQVATSRFYNGTIELGLRSQGPSFTMPEIAGQLTTPEAFDRMIGHYVNYLAGASYDDNKTDAENDAALMRAMEASSKAMASWHYSYWFSGTCGPSHAQAGGTREILVAPTGNIALEFDAEKKKYNLLFKPMFGDTMPSLDAVQGDSVQNEGCEEAETRSHIQTGFFPGGEERIESMDPPFDNGPLGANIVRDLPPSFGPLSGSSMHSAKVTFNGQLNGTYNITYTLSPNPPAPVELWIIPPADLADWRPIGNKDEKTRGDYVPVTVKLQKPGGGDPQFKAIRFTYRLKNVSREKGVCMNAPRIPDPDNPFDMQFEADLNVDFDIIGTERQAAVQSGDKMTEGSVDVSVFDYAATGEIDVFAELENGQVVYGKVQGTNESALKLPKRSDANSLVADVFKKNLGNLPDMDDEETDPAGDTYNGDGLTLFEEYRGFKNGDYWMAGDPKKKEVFVYNQMRGNPLVQRGISVFEAATKLKVHRLLKDDQVNLDMVVNFNHNPQKHLIDQHVIRIKAGKTVKSGNTAAFVEKVGTPGTAKSVNMPPDWGEFKTVMGRQIPKFERTLAHEMSHDVNVYHHGEQDKDVFWGYAENPVPHIYESEAVGSRLDIIVLREDGTEVSAADLFPPNTPDGNGFNDLKLGMPQGQHSGPEECLMRYWIAYAYPDKTDPQIRYLSPGEIRGTVLCTKQTGTGVNAASHRPQSRYGDAATTANGGPDVKDNRGKCKDQIRVSDNGPEPKR